MFLGGTTQLGDRKSGNSARVWVRALDLSFLPTKNQVGIHETVGGNRP